MSISERARTFGDTITRNGQSHSMELIMFPLVFFIFTGVIANNFQATSIQTVPALPNPCQKVAICYPTNTNGCDVNKSGCNFTAITGFQFLNRNSPFTQLISGNVLGFFYSLFTNNEQQNSYQTGEIFCVPLLNGAYTNATGQTITGFSCGGDVRYGNQQLANVLPLLNASSNVGNASVWTLVGCPNIVGVTCNNFGVPSNGQFAQASDNFFYMKNGTTLTTGQCVVQGVTYSQCGIFWRIFSGGSVVTFTCTNFNGTSMRLYNSLINMKKTNPYYCLIPYNSQSNVNFGNSFSGLAFIFGSLLIILGLGITVAAQVAATGFTLGANEQGTRLAETVGIALVTLSFLNSEFSGWLNFLGFGLGLIITLSIDAIFFLGLYWRMFAWN